MNNFSFRSVMFSKAQQMLHLDFDSQCSIEWQNLDKNRQMLAKLLRCEAERQIWFCLEAFGVCDVLSDFASTKLTFAIFVLGSLWNQ